MEENINFLEQFAGQGFENITANDCEIPFLRILQLNATQCLEGSEDYIKGSKPGFFRNTVSDKVYSSSVKLIPLFSERVWLEFKPNRGGFVTRHEPDSFMPDKTDFSNWRNPENGNTIVEFYNFYCLLADFPEEGPIILSLSSTSIKVAKKWNSLILSVRLQSNKIAPYYSSIWEITTGLCKNDKDSWQGIKSIKRIGFVTESLLKDFILPGRKTIDSSKVDYTQLEHKQDMLEDSTEY